MYYPSILPTMWNELFLLYSNIHMLVSTVLDKTWAVGLCAYCKTNEMCLAISADPTVQYLAIQGLWTYSKFALFLEKMVKNIYANSLIIQTAYDYCSWTIEGMDLLFSSRRREPVSEYWLSLCRLSRPPLYSTLEFFETFEILKGPMTSEIQRSFANAFTLYEHGGSRRNDTILLMKMEQTYKVQRYTNEVGPNEVGPNDIQDNSLELEPSQYRFLSVSYTHPSMVYTIDLEIPSVMMMVGNELLSPCFVKRCLEYQSRPYVFDLCYKVHVIDQEVQCFTLTCEEYIQIDKNNCTVKSI